VYSFRFLFINRVFQCIVSENNPFNIEDLGHIAVVQLIKNDKLKTHSCGHTDKKSQTYKTQSCCPTDLICQT
jgi:hypothetical protein